MTRESIDSLARRLAESMPQGLRALRADVEENFRQVLKSSLARMDLVTREEFEVQEAVLARTREKLEALEARLATYEAGREAPTPVRRKTGRKKAKKKPAQRRGSDKGAARDD
ncbi:MAG: accessory factor UbiK family protein [Woeseiaceae bacterium]|nr:accessory factor UbiK family protein [Woeseiaceae bacterium]